MRLFTWFARITPYTQPSVALAQIVDWQKKHSLDLRRRVAALADEFQVRGLDKAEIARVLIEQGQGLNKVGKSD